MFNDPSAEVISSWEIFEPVLDSWRNSDNQLPTYKKGSYGPDVADELAKDYGSEWINIAGNELDRTY